MHLGFAFGGGDAVIAHRRTRLLSAISIAGSIAGCAGFLILQADRDGWRHLARPAHLRQDGGDLRQSHF